MPDLHRSTLAVSAGRPAHAAGNPVNVPIAVSATFHLAGDQEYVRDTGGDTVLALEQALGALEGGRALAFGSGMAAAAAVFDTLPVGSVVVAPRVCYQGVSALLTEAEAKGRLVLRRVEISDTEAVVAALQESPTPSLLWGETPTNPMVTVADVAALATAAHQVGAIFGVDSTWNTPLLLRPLEHGANIVMHSATKYLGGHSDVLIGALVVRDAALHQQLLDHRHLSGAMPGMLEAFLTLRGIRTLDVRLERAQHNAGELARRLDADPRIERVLYPGLPSDPGHELSGRQSDGYGAMMSFLVAGDGDAAQAVCDRVRLITHATSLGGVESLIERRARYAGERANGVPENLVRLSVGIEHVEDLWADLDQALG